MSLKNVKKALKKLTKCSSFESVEEKDTVFKEAFCFEDTFATKDLKVIVNNVGEIPMPLTEDFVKKIINVSSKAKFGQGEATVLDPKVRDTQMIPATDLTVEIDKDCVESLLTRAASGLNITQKCTLVPHLHNMLVYGPGQFFKMHRDSEKLPNMVATLVIVLPSFHKGGDLVVQHDNSKHVFFGSQNASFVKCIIFYSDCLHEILPVIEGYRVAITYNVVLNSLEEAIDDQVHEALDKALKDYFSSETRTGKPQKLVYALNHKYSESNLKWGLLKGQDRTCGFALLAIAKQQNFIPCLALGQFRRLFDVECSRWTSEENLVEEETTLDYFVDAQNSKFIQDEVNVDDEELCSFSRTEDIFEPYETEASGPTGNEGNTVEHWYRRGFVVLWPSGWDTSQGYKQCLRQLHRSIHSSEEGKEVVSLEEIKKLKSKIIQVNHWKDPKVIKYVFDIVVSLNDKEMAVAILSKLFDQMIKPDKIDWVLKLEGQFDDETWRDILKHWSPNYWTISDVPSFLEEYLKHPSRRPSSLLIKYLAEKHVQNLYMSPNSSNVYLLEIVAYLGDKETGIAILSKLSEEMIQADKVDWILKLEAQFDNDMWLKVMESWVKKTHAMSKVPLLIEEYLKHPARKAESSVVKLLSENHVQNFVEVNKDDQTNCKLDFYYADQWHWVKAETLCATLKMCFDLENAFLETKLIQHIAKNPNTFQPKTILNLLVLLESKFSPEKFRSYQCLRDGAIKCLETNMAKTTNPNFWEIKKSFKCSRFQCETCPLVRKFLCSKDTQKYCLSVNANLRKHTSTVLKALEQAQELVTSTDNSKRPAALVIEKNKRVFQENKSRADELETLKINLQKIQFLEEARGISKETENSSGTPLSMNGDNSKEEILKKVEKNMPDDWQEDSRSLAKRMKIE